MSIRLGMRLHYMSLHTHKLGSSPNFWVRLYAYHGCTPRGVSILRIPLVLPFYCSPITSLLLFPSHPLPTSAALSSHKATTCTNLSTLGTFPAQTAINLSFSPSSVNITEGTSRELSPSLCIVKDGEAEIDIPVTITSVDGTAEGK